MYVNEHMKVVQLCYLYSREPFMIALFKRGYGHLEAIFHRRKIIKFARLPMEEEEGTVKSADEGIALYCWRLCSGGSRPSK
jgi:hypothetical protein